MGLFDFFDDANAQFKKDVKKAWDELWDNDTSDDDDDDCDDDDDDDDSSEGEKGSLKGIFNAYMDIVGPSSGPIVDGPNQPSVFKTLKEIKKYERQASGVKSLLNGGAICTKPVPGTPVYCNLAVVAEHTGIYIGNGKIAHLTGDGDIETVSPNEFCARLDGNNPASTIYFAQFGGKALGSKKIADRARSMIGGRRNYSVLFDNCHQFTCGCLSGDFENPCNLFCMVEMEIRDKLGAFTWEIWDY